MTTESPPLLFFFDYADPLSWLLDERLAALSGQSSLRVERFPFPFDPPDWPARRAAAAQHAASSDGGSTLPALPSPGHKAFELALLAAERGCFDRVHNGIFQAHFSGGRDIGRIDELVRIATAAGLDFSEAKAVLDVDKFSDTIQEWRRRALALGVTTAPTLLMGTHRAEGFAALEVDPLTWATDVQNQP